MLNSDLDLTENQLLNVKIENESVAPTCDGTTAGKIYFNTTDNLTYVCDGTSFNQLEK